MTSAHRFKTAGTHRCGRQSGRTHPYPSQEGILGIGPGENPPLPLPGGEFGNRPWGRTHPYPSQEGSLGIGPGENPPLPLPGGEFGNRPWGEPTPTPPRRGFWESASRNTSLLYCPLSIVNCPLSLTVDDNLGEIGDPEIAVGMLAEFVGEFKDFLG